MYDEIVGIGRPPAFAAAAMVIALGTLGPVNTVFAADSDEDARAVDLKARGDRALEDGNALDALKAYDQAYALRPAPQILYNRGRALQALGRYPESLDDLERFESAAPPELIARVTNFSLLIRDVRAHVGRIDVHCACNGAAVVIEGRAYGNMPLAPLRVNAGNARVQVHQAGFATWQRDVVVTGGGLVVVEPSLAPLPAPPASHPPAPESHSVLGQWWFWAGAGVLVAGGVVTIVLLTRPGAAESGTLAPGQVSAPLLRF